MNTSRLRPSRRPQRPAHTGHGIGCSSNPEIGCLCGEDERASLRSEKPAPRPQPVAVPFVDDPSEPF